MIAVGTLDASHRVALSDLLRATGAFTDDEIAVALELFDETYGAEADAAAPSDYEFVAAFGDDGSLAGYGCYGATPATVGTYDLYWIAVDPSRQGLGVGAALLAEVERRIEGRAARLLLVETSGRVGYEAARRFYGAHGYEVTARVRDFYAPADDRVIFTRHLGSSPSPANSGA